MLNLDWHFFPVFDRLDPATAYPGTYNLGLVATSLAIAILAAFVALSISGRIVAASTRRARYAWASAGAISMGGGIWSMHFVGMLAFSLPCGITYDPLGTVFSMIPGMLASGIALGAISKPDEPGLSRLSVSAVLIGVGVAAMHYSGMSAMRPEALLRYNPRLVAVSIVVAVVLAFVSLSIRFLFHRPQSSRTAATIIAASIMGCAVAGMHYTAMEASIFFPLPDAPTRSMALSPTLLALLITIFIVLIAVTTLLATFAGRQSELALSLSAEISRRKCTEDGLRESEQRFRDFSESASDWYWETGPDHRFTAHLVSDQQLKTIGVLPDSRIGTVRWDFARDLEEEPEKWRQHIADLDAHKPFRDFRYRAASRDGSDIYIAASGKALFDSKGRFLGYRGVGRHITAAVRAALLEEALQEAKVVGDNIAHDLRAPLTRVRLRLERGREHAATLEELRAVADQAIAGLDQSLTTITALLRITEIENSRRREGFSEVQLAPLIHEVGDLYDPIAEDKGVALRVKTPEGACVRGDRDLLFEAVTNLVDNAVKFTPEGGHVELALLYQEGETVIRVSDSGPGIAEIEREAVTQRFYRSDKTRNTKGLGLGLSMVAAIIKLHSFRLSISAGPGCTTEIACPGVH
jgi:PAS domain S-box-containing protein